MTKTPNNSVGKQRAKAPLATTKVVRNVKTGQFVTVKGLGALKGSSLKIRKDIDLLKPIAEQALVGRPEEREAG